MRVITGTAKGHRLVSLEGRDTRPTTDRVKEAMFSIIQLYIADSVVLDLFAGSGALGIEALSRGAAWCDFVEQSKSAVDIIKTNLQKTRLDNCEIFNVSAVSYLNKCDKKYDIVLLDPPYKKGLCDASVKLLGELGLLSENAVIVCETSAEEDLSLPYSILRQSKYGNTQITVYENG